MNAFLILVIPSYFSEPKRHHRADTELGIHEELAAGCFLTGHPQVSEPIGNAMLGFGEERVFLFGSGAMPLGSVSYGSIVGVSVEGHAAVLARFSQERMSLQQLLVGGNELLITEGEELGAALLAIPGNQHFCRCLIDGFLYLAGYKTTQQTQDQPDNQEPEPTTI